MEYSQTDFESLIVGFFTNSLNEDELGTMNRWLNDDESHRKEFAALRSAWIISGYDAGKKRFDTRKGWAAMDKKLKPTKTAWLAKMSPLRYAASLLLCVALGSAVSIIFSHRQPETPPMQTSMHTTTVFAPLGSKSAVTLPDGSTVWLNAGSEIEYKTDFGIENRNIKLTGEAYFDVKSDSLNPFNVHVQGMTVRALGTRFNVKAYPDDNTVTATLEEGIVDVLIHASDGKNIVQSVKLQPKEQLVVQKTDEATEQPVVATTTPAQTQETDLQTNMQAPAFKEMTIIPNVNTALSTSWKDKKWIISDEPLDRFAENLERRYNISIRFDSEELKNYKFSGTFENETVEQILFALSLAAPVNYRFDKNTVTLSLNVRNMDKFNKILRTDR